MKYRLLVLSLVFLLIGCKVDLYSNLSEVDANQMQAVLAYNKIHSSKNENKSNGFTLKVDENDFVKAVEVLRQNGYPKKQYRSIDELFPTGQLITSPVQEQAKLRFLREQNLERMLSNVEGVISVNVMIVDVENDSRQRKLTEPSVSVLIKHSPEVNVRAFNIKIKHLINNALPGVKLENISLVSQMVNYRFDYSNSDPFEIDTRLYDEKTNLIDEEKKAISKQETSKQETSATVTQLNHDSIKQDSIKQDSIIANEGEVTIIETLKNNEINILKNIDSTVSSKAIPEITSESNKGSLNNDSHDELLSGVINNFSFSDFIDFSNFIDFSFDDVNFGFADINTDNISEKFLYKLSQVPTWVIWLFWFICILGIVFHAIKNPKLEE